MNYSQLQEKYMSRKSILASLFLICVGIVFGVILVSSFGGGIEAGFAGDPTVKLGAPRPITNSQFDLRNANRAFIEVSKAVTPTVVNVIVTTKAKEQSNDMQEFFHFFGPDYKFREPSPQQGSGSGVIISPEGYILTNNHVVDEAQDGGVEVILNDTRRLKARITGTDPTTDLAVIKVEGDNLPTAAFGNSDSLEVGEWVLAIGNPLGLSSTVTAGIISATGRNIGIIQDNQGYGIENFVQTDAAINPGNSGGPLVNLNGEVIGINSAIATTNQRYQGYGFAIPINLARSVAEDLIRFGKIRRGYIGVNIQSVDETTAKAIGLDRAKGVLIQGIVDDGAAKAAGLREGDVILSVDGREVNQSNELQSFIARKHPGDEVKLKVFRDGKTFDKILTLKERKDDKTASNDDGASERDEEGDARDNSPKSLTFEGLGFSVALPTRAQKKNAGIDNGIVVQNVRTYSEAFDRGLRDGDIIVEADKKELSSAREFKQIVDKRKPGDALLLRVKKGSDRTVFIALQIPKE
jgi:serine protease Do